MQRLFWPGFIVISFTLLVGAWREWLPLGLTEVFGFITGAACVWLIVRENIWNWPVGIANNVFFIVLFWEARLFADMGLQVVYIALAILGWYWWLHGGKDRTEIHVSHAPRTTLLALALIVAVSTYGMTIYLESVNDAAPFWDALTTMLSLAAQYLLTRKWIENWYVWIGADIIYISLYFHRHLYLTSILYMVFMAMCLAGLMAWRRSMVLHRDGAVPVAPGAAADV